MASQTVVQANSARSRPAPGQRQHHRGQQHGGGVQDEHRRRETATSTTSSQSPSTDHGPVRAARAKGRTTRPVGDVGHDGDASRNPSTGTTRSAGSSTGSPYPRRSPVRGDGRDSGVDKTGVAQAPGSVVAEGPVRPVAREPRRPRRTGRAGPGRRSPCRRCSRSSVSAAGGSSAVHSPISTGIRRLSRVTSRRHPRRTARRCVSNPARRCHQVNSRYRCTSSTACPPSRRRPSVQAIRRAW